MHNICATKGTAMAILDVNHICKSFGSFAIKDISFEIEPGYIVGFIGRNGAGKTTTLKSILGVTKVDSGSVTYMGKSTADSNVKQELGIILGEFTYYRHVKIAKLTKAVKRFFVNWNDDTYNEYIRRFGIDENKRVKELSSGMKVKYSLAIALSHEAKLLILDEPTSGLDPISRDEILDIFRSIVADGEHSILFSTHITSDLDKCADYVIYIKNGEITMSGDREEIINGFRLVQGGMDALTPELGHRLIGYKTNAFGFSGLIREDDIEIAKDLMTARADIESIMLYNEKYVNEEAVK